MNLKNLYIIASIIFLIAGLGSLFFPEQALSNFGLMPDETGMIMSRRFGALLLGVAVLLWMSRNTDKLQRAILAGVLVAISLNAIVILVGILSGLLSALAWLALIFSFLFAIGFAYFLFVKRSW
jgi:heme A synthase